jgi:hypothetical protein
MSNIYLVSLGIGTILAGILSCAAIYRSSAVFRDAKFTRKLLQMDAEVADCLEKQEHLTTLFKKFSARIAQRERRRNEKDNSGKSDSLSELTGEDWKKQYRKDHITELALNGRK